MRWLALVLVAGCGDGKHNPDAAADMTVMPDAATGPVTLTITKEGLPVAGVHVYFQNSNSTLVADATTDAAGHASADMAAGGFVTAINPFDTVQAPTSDDDLRTFAGVKPGDQLVLDQPFIDSIAVNISG